MVAPANEATSSSALSSIPSLEEKELSFVENVTRTASFWQRATSIYLSYKVRRYRPAEGLGFADGWGHDWTPCPYRQSCLPVLARPLKPAPVTC